MISAFNASRGDALVCLRCMGDAPPNMHPAHFVLSAHLMRLMMPYPYK